VGKYHTAKKCGYSKGQIQKQRKRRLLFLRDARSLSREDVRLELALKEL
jgi:hypothetical protein